MKNTDKARLALKTLISANDHLFNCEEMLRNGYVIQKEKQLTNRMVKELLKTVSAYENLDNNVDQFETILIANRRFLDACAAVPITLRSLVADTIERDIIKTNRTPLQVKIDALFDEIIENKPLDKRSEITQLKNKLKQLVK